MKLYLHPTAPGLLLKPRLAAIQSGTHGGIRSDTPHPIAAPRAKLGCSGRLLRKLSNPGLKIRRNLQNSDVMAVGSVTALWAWVETGLLTFRQKPSNARGVV